VLCSAMLTLFIIGLSVRPFPLFVNSLTCALGTISYSCYLTHFVALRIVIRSLRPEWFAKIPYVKTDVSFLVICALGLALTAVFSAITYWLIERPGIWVGKLLIRRGERQLPVIASPPRHVASE
jgi:peptidoglycan/LPS O-acetylase OafA/YrhL